MKDFIIHCDRLSVSKVIRIILFDFANDRYQFIDGHRIDIMLCVGIYVHFCDVDISFYHVRILTVTQEVISEEGYRALILRDKVVVKAVFPDRICSISSALAFIRFGRNMDAAMVV
jgi:hypothetical protein